MQSSRNGFYIVGEVASFDLDTLMCYGNFESSKFFKNPEVIGAHFHETYHYIQFASSTFGILWAFSNSMQARYVKECWDRISNDLKSKKIELPLLLSSDEKINFEKLKNFKADSLFGCLHKVTLEDIIKWLGINSSLLCEMELDLSTSIPTEAIFEPKALKAGSSWVRLLYNEDEAFKYYCSHEFSLEHGIVKQVGYLLGIPDQTLDIILDISLLPPLSAFLYRDPKKQHINIDTSDVLTAILQSYMLPEQKIFYSPIFRFFAAVNVIKNKPDLHTLEINDKIYLEIYEAISKELSWPSFDILMKQLLYFCHQAERFRPTDLFMDTLDSWNFEKPWSLYKIIFSEIFAKFIKIRLANPSIIAESVNCMENYELAKHQFYWCLHDITTFWYSNGTENEDLRQTQMTLTYAFINSITEFLMEGKKWKCPLSHSCNKEVCKNLTSTQDYNCVGVDWFKSIVGILPNIFVTR